MSANTAILVATEVVADADLVRKLLSEEFDSIAVSTHPERAVQDFEKHRPAVLVLAFDTLEKAERYYLGLYRLSSQVHALPHRTVILCGKADLPQVYALCRKEHFDDYVLFWPMNQDALRLPMAVHHALRQTAAVESGPTVGEFAAQARRIAELEALLERSLAQGGARLEVADQSLKQAQKDIGAALDDFTRHLSAGGRLDLLEVRDHAGFQQEIDRLKTEEIDRHLQSVGAAVQPVRQWMGSIKGDLASQLVAAQALQALAERVRPVVLVVDDDEFQHKLLARLLADANLELVFATSSTEALALLQRYRPDLILMDINLPDIDGVETTRRIKSSGQFAAIPVVMITGQSEKSVVVESLKSGASGFVVKPFDKGVLLAKVRTFLSGASSS